jgi:hypothetical protein
MNDKQKAEKTSDSSYSKNQPYGRLAKGLKQEIGRIIAKKTHEGSN